MVHHRLSSWNWLILCLLPSACSSYAPPQAVVGMSRDQIVARMGEPDAELPLNQGVRLEFARGPFGRHTWFVYVDSGGRVSRAEQVLNEQNFSLISPGMTHDDVRQILGRPSEMEMLARERGLVWNFRYENNSCLWFQVELSLERKVRSTGYGEPPECRGPNVRRD